ncbi:MAG: hypothetical protein ACPGU1_12665 [Myxococcota bacterium]
MNDDPTILAAKSGAKARYDGVVTPHRSCGIALAETFGRATAPYQSLRRGGITGCGECGAVAGGRLVVGELLGDPDPAGPVTPSLRGAMVDFEGKLRGRIDRGKAEGEDLICNTLTGQFEDFRSPERAAFCAQIVSEVAALVAEVVVEQGHTITVTPVTHDET